MAHEFAHIKNRDILVTSIAAMIAGAISAIANILQFPWLFGGGDDDDSPLGFVGAHRADHHRADRRGAAAARASRASASSSPTRPPRELFGEGRPLADALGTLERGVEACRCRSTPQRRRSTSSNPLSRHGRCHEALLDAPADRRPRIERLRDVRREARHP